MNNTGGASLYNTNKTEAEIEEGRLKACQNFESDYLKIINTLRNHCNPKFILLTPTAYDETLVSDVPATIGKNKTLSIISEIVRKIAVNEKAELVEFYTPFSELNTKLQANNPTFSLANKDRVHPPLQTHLYLGYLFLKSRKVTNVVATIKIDANNLDTKDCKNATINKIKTTTNKISFDCLENSLPFPIKNDTKEVLNWVPFEQDINQEVLIVNNLPSMNYDLLIDDIKVGTYETKTLSKGINLAAIQTTPQNIQAQMVLAASLDYANKCSILRKVISADIMLRNDKIEVANETIYSEYKVKKIAFNGYYKSVFDDYDKYKEDRNQLYAIIEDAYQKIYSINKPTVHNFTLVAV
jgi:endoglucanase